MKKRNRRRQAQALVISVLIHVALIGLAVFSIVPSLPPESSPVSEQRPPVVEATAVSPQEVERLLQRKRERDRKQREQAAARQRAQEEARLKAEEEQKRLEQARLKAEEEQKHLEQARLKAEKEKKRLEREQTEAKREQQRLKQETQRAAEKEKQRLAEEAARKLKEEQERLEQEARRAVEEEKQRLAEEAQRKAEAEEQERIRRVKISAWTREYIQGIRSSIERQWKRPPASVKGGDCVVKLRQDRNGNIEKVQVVSCDGDRLYVRSVEDAVWKANPLPSPPSWDVFDHEVEITFRKDYDDS